MNIIKQLKIIKRINIIDQINGIDTTDNTIKQIDIICDKYNINILREFNKHIFHEFNIENKYLLTDDQLIEINKKTINNINNSLSSIQYDNKYENEYDYKVNRVYWYYGCKPEFKYVLDPTKKTQQIYQYDFISNKCFEIYTRPDYGFELVRGIFVALFFWNPYAWMAYTSSPVIITKKEVQNNVITNLVKNEIENKIRLCNEKILHKINEEIYTINKHEIILYIATTTETETETNDNVKQYLKQYLNIKRIMAALGGLAFFN